MEVATLAFDRLLEKHGDRIEGVCSTVESFEKKTLAKARQVLRLAALLHDIGHAPFCHAAEDIYFEKIEGKHAALSTQIIQEDLGELLDSNYWPGCSKRVASIINPKGEIEFPRQFKIIRDLISGEMDADRTDYLLRDSYFCGVDYGRFDYKRMIECLEIHEPDEGTLEVALHRDGIHTFEALILARYHMNVQVYYHRVRRIYDIYLKEYHKSLGGKCPQDKHQILAENDLTMMAQIMRDAENGSGDRKKWAERISMRNHHRVIFDTTFNADAKVIARARKVLDWLKTQFPDYQFMIDPIKPATIHKQFIPDDPEETGLEELYLHGFGKPYHSMGEESPVIRGIPRKFQCARIYSNVDPDNKVLREDMTAFAFKKYSDLGGR